jgi:pimeloyl-ACP methyl ester carboxylesterase
VGEGRVHTVGRRVAVTLAVVLLAAGVAGVAAAKPGKGVVPAPVGLPKFYEVPKPLPTTPGTLVKSQRMTAPNVHGTVYRVMYVSQSNQGTPVAVTGIVIVPNGKAPAGGFPVVSWAHGTNGMADQCAPSLKPGGEAPAANQLLDKGWLLTATDYQGEGTPGLHPYIAGPNAARDAIDIVRAARRLRSAHAGTNYVVWGHSQGGHTAMFALHIAAEYAPELHLKGVVAGAPPSQFKFIYGFLKTSRYRYYLLMAAGGLNAAYGDKVAPLNQILTPAGRALLPELDKGCSDYLSKKFANLNFDDLVTADPFTIPAWQQLLTANDPESFSAASATPLLIIHGGNDEQIPTGASGILADHLCGVGQGLERWVFPGQSHSGVISPSVDDMIHWIGDRFTGDARPGSFAPSGQADVQVTGCPR